MEKHLKFDTYYDNKDNINLILSPHAKVISDISSILQRDYLDLSDQNYCSIAI